MPLPVDMRVREKAPLRLAIYALSVVAPLVVAWTASAQVGPVERRSGTVLAVDRVDESTVSAATLVLRVGPWRIKEEDVVPGSVPMRIKLTPATEIRVLSRSAREAAPPEDVVTTADAIDAGMYATVTYSAHGAELVADRVDLIADPRLLSPVRPSAPSDLVVQPK